MAVDVYIVLVNEDGTLISGESPVDTSSWLCPFPGRPKIQGEVGSVLVVEDLSFEVDQALSVGTGSTGSKVSFKEMTVTRYPDKNSPQLYRMCASGERFKHVDLLLRKSSGGTATSGIYLAYGFSSVIIKSIGYSLLVGAEGPKEKLVFEYEALSMVYRPQKSDGTFENYTPVITWDQVKNSTL